MKVGDLIKKTSGHKDLGEIGVILKFYNEKTPEGYVILDVLKNGSVVAWAANLVEVIDE